MPGHTPQKDSLLSRIGNTLGSAITNTGTGLGGLLGDYARSQAGMPNLTNQQAMGLLRANAAGTGDAYTQTLIAQQREQQLRDAIRNSPLLTPDQQNLFGSAPPAQLQQLLNDISSRQFGASGRNTRSTAIQYFRDKEGNLVLGQPESDGGIFFPPIPEGMTPLGGSMAQDPLTAGAVAGAREEATQAARLSADIERFQDEALMVAEGEYNRQVARPALIDSLELQRQAAAGEAVDAIEIADLRTRIEAVQPAFARIRTREAQNELLNTYFDEARDQANFYTTGLVGGTLSQFRGTQAYDLYNTIQSIKANIGFDKLQDMRDNSPTGGALGQVAVAEIQRLEAVLGSLDQSQSEEQFRANLQRVQDQVNDSWNAVTEAFEREFGVSYHDTNAADLKSFLLQQARSVGQPATQRRTVDF